MTDAAVGLAVQIAAAERELNDLRKRWRDEADAQLLRVIFRVVGVHFQRP
jgi:hypothetical protein